MRDVSGKVTSLREARAEATLRVSPTTIDLLRSGKAPKGDPLPVARVAAIQAAKNTPQIIPYCHHVPVDYVGVDFDISDSAIRVEVEVKAIYRTGVEMEAMTAAAAAVLNLFDLLKPVDKAMTVESVRLLEKTGGKTQFAYPEAFRATVIVVSDSVSGGKARDRSGELLRQRLCEEGGVVGEVVVTPDDVDAISTAVLGAVALDPELVMLTGGTGAGPRDHTPAAIVPLLSARLNGIEHRLHAYGQDRLPTAMLGRPFAGLVDKSIVIGLPGAPGAVEDAVRALFPYLKHAFHIVRGGGHDR
ncbi:MAG: hypothetical protein HONBIEJF_02184 [Fimbriimonadaceae bacterium]|nr:hypothetical protein [Fimbriimonadaceae bacterium]